MARLPYRQFRRIYRQVPRLCVDLIITSPQGVLLSLRKIKPWPNQWHFPGGTVFHGETIEQAAQRIAQEEAGITIKIVKDLGYIEFPSVTGEGGFDWPISIALQAEITGGKPQFNPAEASELGFWRKLPPNMIGEHRSFLEKTGLLA